MNVRENFETITKEISETCAKVGRNADPDFDSFERKIL